MRSSSQPQAGAMRTASTRPQTHTTASQTAYQRSGWALRSIRRPSANAPTAKPPKKAVIVARTAAAS